MVLGEARFGRTLGQRLSIQALLKQVAYTTPGEGAQLDGPFGGGFQARIAIAASQREQPEAGAVAHFRVRLVGQLVIDQLAREIGRASCRERV